MSSALPGMLWKLYGALMPTWTPAQLESILAPNNVDAGSAAAASLPKSRRVRFMSQMITRGATGRSKGEEGFPPQRRASLQGKAVLTPGTARVYPALQWRIDRIS